MFVFLIVGLLTIMGIMGGHGPIGFKNYTTGAAPFVGGIPATLAVFVVAGFSFQGTELIGITAGESETPETSFLAYFAVLYPVDCRDCRHYSVH